MRHLILSAAIPALLMGACATLPGPAVAPPAVVAERAPPPHFPADLSPAGVAAADDHLDLEQVQGEAAMAFVARENAAALAALTGDPRYEPYRQQAFAILSATDRIPAPSFLGDGIGNFWQDAANPKGVWRRTTLDSYRSADPQWETLLDIGALSAAEGRDWVFKGANCLAPDETRCLVNLSDGGRDAVVVREFDLTTKRFVAGGFTLPEGKHRLSWLDRNTLLVATDFGPGTLTESGYPFIIKTLTRGQTLAQATEVYRGDIGDGGYGVSARVLRDGRGAVLAVLFNRPLDTFSSETVQWLDGRAVKLSLPAKVNVQGAIRDQLIFSVDQSWTQAGETFRAGSLMAAPLAGLRDGQGRAETIFAPADRQSVEEVSVFDNRVVATVYDNVRGRMMRFLDTRGRGWLKADVDVPDNVAVHLGDSSRGSDRQFYSFEGFLTPATLNLLDMRVGPAGRTEQIAAAPARFEASTHVVEQFEATSSDGTKIPYFVTRPRDLVMDGHAPTIMYGYGGFQVSKPPAYIPEMGRLWLEKGGVYVNANIRGGGEFGPDWHQAVLNENRQMAFDDFAAVARDLQARGITSPRRLGIYGRSNGGVLTSVMVTQHPELINAAVIESPLIDMLRYHELPAGASWIGEYGDPRIPEEAAWIAGYSAYQQLRPDADYPRVYITTNTLDDRVHAGHARKFAARLGDQGHDHLYYEETSGGHSNDADPVANARRWARHYVYLAQQLMD
ncbi:prolyl oligopeptidase family serine peptidase [uncultured Brevundimonas sp.]|uniref:prolyl oligopeptidase family serine peptidase n=1 Tax=uncultured Brevundimonas sp. TaxID=213418 RepID=UPI0030EC0DFE|tara:strand:- start:55928 stop:58120 length:2193 start_codon:yes stop_codon:yes gene_type:complete